MSAYIYMSLYIYIYPFAIYMSICVLLVCVCVKVASRENTKNTIVSKLKKNPPKTSLMLPKIAADDEKPGIIVREYDEEKDKIGVEELEKTCEVVQKGKPSVVTDLMGDPIGRVRHLPLHVMLVAENNVREEKEIVGVIRGTIKTVTRGKKDPSGSPVYVKLAYILGLRVSPTHRRLGVATKLVRQIEEWGKQNGADYAYMATDCSNQASINLFTLKCNYIKFRTPKVLVQPVHLHSKPIGSGIAIVQVSPKLAEAYYRRIFADSECFPNDIDNILQHKLNLGTFMAVPRETTLSNWDPKSGNLPNSFAILSIWNTKEVFKLQVKGVSAMKSAFCLGVRVLDGLLPWLRVPSMPDVFRSFGIHFLYGLHMEGKDGWRLMRSLGAFAHNMAAGGDGDCGVLVAEVGQMDPVGEAIPHCRKYSWDEDLWCIKKIKKEGDNESDHETCDWIQSWKKSSPPSVIFIDPRDF